MGRPLDDAGLDTIFRTARTYNGYDDTPVTEADIRRIYDLLKMGPTSANQQSARFVWLLSQESKDKLADLSSNTNAAKIRKAPAASAEWWWRARPCSAPAMSRPSPASTRASPIAPR